MSPDSRKVGEPERRILVVDDNPSICQDFRKILCPAAAPSHLASLEASVFGSSTPPSRVGAHGQFLVDVCSQGREGLDAVRRMVRLQTPYALAFVDMRMPPGWDGVETAARIWEVDAEISIVICSAYSDYSWHEVVRRLNRPALRLLQKPFETSEVLELAWSLTSKRLKKPGP